MLGDLALCWRDECTHTIFHTSTMLRDMSAFKVNDFAQKPRSEDTSSSRNDIHMGTNARHAKTVKRHVGNDCVHVLYVDSIASVGAGSAQDEWEQAMESHVEFDPGALLAGKFALVRITVYAMVQAVPSYGSNDRDHRTATGENTEVRGKGVTPDTQPSSGLYYRIHVKARPGVPPFGPLSSGSVHVLPERAAVAAVRLTAMHADRACSVLHEGQVQQSSWESRLKQLTRIAERLAL